MRLVAALYLNLNVCIFLGQSWSQVVKCSKQFFVGNKNVVSKRKPTVNVGVVSERKIKNPKSF